MSSAHHSACGMRESEQEQEGNFLLLIGDVNYLYVFLNGVLRFQTARVNIPINSEDLAIGRLYSDYLYYYFTGYVDEIAVRDYAVWTSDFIPPTTMYEN